MSVTSSESPGVGSDLVVYDRVTDPAAFIATLGDAIFKSGMFGCESAPQGRVLALECAARKAPPLMLAERYHVIKGKLSMKAEAMLADFTQRAGGRYEIIERSSDRAAIAMTRDGQTQAFELTWEQAAAEPFVYAGREDVVVEQLAAGKREKLRVKPKYATPRARMQMLWARVVSDSVRAMAPEVVSGCYTPEEISDFDYVRAGDNGRKKATAESATNEEAGDQVIDVEPIEPNPGGGVPVPTPSFAADNPEQAEAIANADGGKTIKLMADQQTLDAAVHETVVAQAKQSQQPPAAFTPPSSTGQATKQQIDAVKALVAELAVPKERLMAILGRVGAAKVSDMSAAHCASLIDVLTKEKAKRATGKN